MCIGLCKKVLRFFFIPTNKQHYQIQCYKPFPQFLSFIRISIKYKNHYIFFYVFYLLSVYYAIHLC
jgi:hypothetical protein